MVHLVVVDDVILKLLPGYILKEQKMGIVSLPEKQGAEEPIFLPLYVLKFVLKCELMGQKMGDKFFLGTWG